MPVDRYLNVVSAKRRTIRSSDEFVAIEPPSGATSIPLIIRPLIDSLKLHTWVDRNMATVNDLLQKRGAILFRGFDVISQEDFRLFIQSMNLDLIRYMEGATPRKSLGENVYTSTEFPPEYPIALHNENSYVITWPMKICFCCMIAPEDRGETPIADVREVYKRIDPEIRGAFEKRGYMLVRNFSDHLGLHWKESFHVSTREALESYCRRARIQAEWKSAGRLKTVQVRPAVAIHPKTHEPTWFNHIAFWHSSSLEKRVRDMLLSEYSEDDLPYNTYYGDGAPIEISVIEHLRHAYEAEMIKFRWEKGDILLLDNMLVAHGRSPFSGPRKIIVSMGEPYTPADR